MGAPSEIYVDPAIGDNSGSGTIGDPYGDIQNAFQSTTRDSTNGDRFNIKAGVDEVLPGSLSLSVYGTPTTAAPLILQGYTSAAGDGGVGGISGSGSYAMWASVGYDNISMADLHLHNSGAATIVRIDDSCSVVRCEIDNSTGGSVELGDMALIFGNYVHNTGGSGLECVSGKICNNYLKNGTNDFTSAIKVTSSSIQAMICFNVINVDGATNGIQGNGGHHIAQNTVYSNGGTGFGIDAASGIGSTIVLGNYIEGFSGGGGDGLIFGNTSNVCVWGGNAVFNCETAYTDNSEYILIDLGGNQTLGSSGLTNPGGNDFTVSLAGIKGASRPTGWLSLSGNTQHLEIGAVQLTAGDGASGGLLGPNRQSGRQG